MSVSSLAHVALMQTLIPKKPPATPADEPSPQGKRQMHVESPPAQPKVPKETPKAPAPLTPVASASVDDASPPPESKKRKPSRLEEEEEQEQDEEVHLFFLLYLLGCGCSR